MSSPVFSDDEGLGSKVQNIRMRAAGANRVEKV